MSFSDNTKAVNSKEESQQKSLMSLNKRTSRNMLCGFSLEKDTENTSVEFDENNNPISKEPETTRAKRARKRRELDKENVEYTMCTRTLRSSKRLKKQETFDTSEISQSLRVKDRKDSKLKNKSLNIQNTPVTKPKREDSLSVECKQNSQEDEGCLKESDISPILKTLVTYEVDECEQIERNDDIPTVADNQISLEAGLLLDFNKSSEIPSIAFDFNENQNSKIDLTDQPKTVEQSVPLNLSPVHVGLNLSCHSDASYNFEELDPFRALTEELDENNNLVMRHDKLKSFVVTSNLNKNHDYPQTTNSMNRESYLEVLDEINMLSKENVMNFRGFEPVELDHDNYNFKFFRGIFNNSDIENDLGLSVCRSGNIDFENFTSPLLVIEDQALQLEQQDLRKQQQESNQKETEKKEPEDIKIESNKKAIINRLKQQSKDKETQYAITIAFEIFTNDELATGIFCELNKKGEQIIRSKTRIPLDEAKTYKLKEKIRNKFKMDFDTLEKAWKFIRSDLNKLISTNTKRLQHA